MPSSVLSAIFLRGVNVGGVTVKSAPLRDCLESVDGVEAAKTVLASGNAVVRTTLDPDPLRAAVEKALQDAFGYDAWVVVLSLDQVADLVDRCPYALDDRTIHAYITLASDPAALDALEGVAADVEQEFTRLTPSAFAWPCPAGGSVQVPFAKAQTTRPARQHQQAVTTRNGRTLVRVLKAAEALDPR